MRSLVILVSLAFTLQLSWAATHSYQYIYTAVTPGINFPEFSTVGMVDGEMINYYDSDIKKTIPKGDWITKSVDPDYWKTTTQIQQGHEDWFKANLPRAMQRFNQTKGVHTVQLMYGCELDDDGTKRGYHQYGFDGQDFISLVLNTETWTAPVPQAFPTKLKWEKTTYAVQEKAYLESTCIEWLQKYVGYGKDTLERKVSPKVDVFQKDSSSSLVCHATGFFPKSVMISWQKNGEELHEDAELRETLPNQDGTFQKRSVLTVSPEELKNNEYTCVVQHSSLKEDIRKGLPGGGMVGIIIAVVAVLLLVLIGCVGVFIWKKKKSGFKPVSGNPNAPSDGENSSTNS